MRLILVTHADTDWTVGRRLQGHSDIPLNEAGLAQAAGLAKRLAVETPREIIASDLSRARQTAEIIATPHRMTVQLEPRLREMSFGSWEGLTYDEVSQRFPDDLAAWESNPVQASPPVGESLAALAQRLQAAARDRINPHALGTDPQLIVAHRGCLRVLLCLLLGIDVGRHWDFQLDVASVTELEIADTAARIVRINEAVPQAQG